MIGALCQEAFVSFRPEAAVVIPLVSDNRAEIAALCERYGVRRLELFGSAVKGTFDPVTSDLDFIVDLGPYEPNLATRSIHLANDLEALFGRSVDLVTASSIRHQYFIDELEATGQVMYAP